MGIMEMLTGVSSEGSSSAVPAFTGNKTLNWILGAAAGISGSIVIGGIIIASIMSDKVRGIAGKFNRGVIRKVYLFVNGVFQIAEPFIRNAWVEEGSRLDHTLRAVDQGLDLFGLLVNSNELASVFSGNRRDY
jgi:hypothetical protein